MSEETRDVLLARMVFDLDRCQHGRHQNDACFGCPGGVSEGNPILQEGTVIGYNVYGQPYVVPERSKRYSAAEWGCR